MPRTVFSDTRPATLARVQNARRRRLEKAVRETVDATGAVVTVVYPDGRTDVYRPGGEISATAGES